MILKTHKWKEEENERKRAEKQSYIRKKLTTDRRKKIEYLYLQSSDQDNIAVKRIITHKSTINTQKIVFKKNDQLFASPAIRVTTPKRLHEKKMKQC